MTFDEVLKDPCRYLSAPAVILFKALEQSNAEQLSYIMKDKKGETVYAMFAIRGSELINAISKVCEEHAEQPTGEPEELEKLEFIDRLEKADRITSVSWTTNLNKKTQLINTCEGRLIYRTLV